MSDSTPVTPSDPALRVRDLGERELLARILARVPPPPPWVVVGIGDDAAVIEPARRTLDVVTTDALIEDVHFDRAFGTPRDLGYKALAVNLSDLAAMGAAPRVGLLSLALPAELPVGDVEALVEGMLDLATRHGVALVGGNLTRSLGPLVIDVTAIGSVKRRAVSARLGARAGDGLYVTGTVGGAAAGLEWLQHHLGRGDPDADGLAECVDRWLRPEPRVRAGLLAARNRIPHAAMDLSDGLADGVAQITQAAGLGATIEADAVPVHDDARRWFSSRQQDPVDAALAGGEDYELLFAVPDRPRSRAQLLARLVAPLPLTRVGTVTAEPALQLRRTTGDTPLPRGFTHF